MGNGHEDEGRTTGTGTWKPRAGFSHVLTSDGQLERLNSEGEIAVSFRRLGPKAPNIEFRGALSDVLCLWHTRSRTGFVSSPTLAADLFTVRFVLSGRMIRRDRSEDHVARGGYAMLVAFDRMRDEEASTGFEAVSATISGDTLLKASSGLEGSDPGSPPRFAPVVEVAGLPMLSLLQTLRSIHSRLSEGEHEMDLVLPLMQEVAAYQLLTCWPRLDAGEVRRSVSPEVRVVLRAKDYIEAHLSRKLLLADVARAAGIGVRGLQVAFRKETGMTPSSFIMGRRLERVRGDLQTLAERGTSVKAIAERWGFTHMSDFSRRYRDRYGETPTSSRSGRR